MMFVKREIAKKLKENGFKEKCFGYYLPSGDAGLIYNYNQYRGGIFEDCLFSHNSLSEDVAGHELIDAPTIEQVLKWMRDIHKLFLSPCVISDYQDDFHRHITYWSFIVINIESGDSIYREYERITEKRYDTYEQAAIAGIEYVLDNLI